MATIILLPHPVYCPEGQVIQSNPGESICQALLRNHIEIEHACDMVCACTTCHIYLREGGDQANTPDELEEDLLDKAWGLDMNSRLSCQVYLPDDDVVTVEIPRYTINHARE